MGKNVTYKTNKADREKRWMWTISPIKEGTCASFSVATYAKTSYHVEEKRDIIYEVYTNSTRKISSAHTRHRRWRFRHLLISHTSATILFALEERQKTEQFNLQD